MLPTAPSPTSPDRPTRCSAAWCWDTCSKGLEPPDLDALFFQGLFDLGLARGRQIEEGRARVTGWLSHLDRHRILHDGVLIDAVPRAIKLGDPGPKRRVSRMDILARTRQREQVGQLAAIR